MTRRALALSAALAAGALVAGPLAEADAHRTRKGKRRAAVRPVEPTPERLACIRWWESRDRYDAVDRRGRHFGAYQFTLPTWRGVARRHRPDLADVRPDFAAAADQDDMASRLLRERGLQPWPTPRRRCR